MFYVFHQRGKHDQIWFYYDSMCKECKNAYTSERDVASKMVFVAYKGGACEDCGGVFHPYLYDFHHTDSLQKEFEVSKYKGRGLTEAIKRELDKCALLCCMCHRLRHIKRMCPINLFESSGARTPSLMSGALTGLLPGAGSNARLAAPVGRIQNAESIDLLAQPIRESKGEVKNRVEEAIESTSVTHTSLNLPLA